jgi:rubrerythrin
LSDWKNSLILEKDETIVGSWEGAREWHDKAESGIIILTNKMIIFLKLEGGLFKKEKTYHQLLTIPLEMVSSVSRGETRKISASIVLKDGKGELFRFSEKNDESSLSQFMGLVRKQVSARKGQLAITGVTKDDSSKKDVIREVVKEKEVIVKIRCRYCGNTYAETLDKCPHCGGHA